MGHSGMPKGRSRVGIGRYFMAESEDMAAVGVVASLGMGFGERWADWAGRRSVLMLPPAELSGGKFESLHFGWATLRGQTRHKWLGWRGWCRARTRVCGDTGLDLQT